MKTGSRIFTTFLAGIAFSLFVSAQSPGKQTYETAATYSREHLGVAVLVMRGDKIVFEDYATDRAAKMSWMLASGTKSFAGVMCAAAIEDKLISGFDEKVADTITEWKTDARKSTITIRQLLSLTSGIDVGVNGTVPDYADAVKVDAKYDPGTHFEYGPVPFQVFGELMTRKLKKQNETVKAYLDRRIIKPIGLDISFWRSKDGQPPFPQGAFITAREWVKFGKFLRDRGKWEGKQLVPAKLLDELVVGSKTNPSYGMSFWLNADGTGPSGGDRQSISGDIGKKMSDKLNVFMAAGAGNQRLYVIPSEDMVVVRFGAFGGYDDREFISKLLTGK